MNHCWAHRRGEGCSSIWAFYLPPERGKAFQTEPSASHLALSALPAALLSLGAPWPHALRRLVPGLSCRLTVPSWRASRACGSGRVGDRILLIRQHLRFHGRPRIRPLGTLHPATMVSVFSEGFWVARAKGGPLRFFPTLRPSLE